GKTYAWQVQVSDINGQETYVNNGYSEVHTFTYGQNTCPTPSNVLSSVAHDGAVNFSWNPVAEASGYTLRYRPASETTFTTVRTEDPEYLLLYQQAGRSYEYQLSTTCQYSGSSPYTAWENFEIPDEGSDLDPEDTTAYISDPELTYEPEIFEPDESQLTAPQQEEPSIEDLLNTPIKIYIPGDENAIESPLSLPTSPTNLSEKEIKALLKSKKPTCAGIVASYSCGNHDTTPMYAGAMVSVAAGDEVAMNSLVISIVDIDGGGNGSGKIKIPMFQNAEVGVSLSGVKVAEGGCIVEGKAELSGVDIALLNEQQRAKLAIAYDIFVQITDAVYNHAEVISETIDNLTDLLSKAKNFAKNYKGSKTEAARAKAYEENIKKAQNALLKSPEVPESLKTVLAASQANAQAAWDFYKTGQPCSVSGKRGGGEASIKFPLADCADYIKNIEDEIEKIDFINDILFQAKTESTMVQKVFEKIKEAKIAGLKSIDLKDIFLPKYANSFEILTSKFRLDGKNITLTNFSIGTNGNYIIDVNTYSGGKGINLEFASLGPNLSYSGSRSNVEKVYKYIIDPPKIDDEMIKKLATKIGVNDWKVLKSITMNETGGGDFFLSGGKTLPKNLFERHLFYNCISSGKIYKKGIKFPTVEIFSNTKILELSQTNPNIINPNQYLRGCKNCGDGKFAINKSNCDKKVNLKNKEWYNETCYLTDEPNYYSRFVNAYEIHSECALMSTSWGTGQIMGFNIRNEYKNVKEMYDDIFDNSPQGQLNKMGYFIDGNKKLKNAINDKDWNEIAKQYNGPSFGDYAKNLRKNYNILNQ
ncbi:MAG: N-acetylmuramidase domain-containing protein, partial [Leadbetterella sp.]|nr:N-acetylmuramidase domain-containing protein [Leadbetterella sp.]